MAPKYYWVRFKKSHWAPDPQWMPAQKDGHYFLLTGDEEGRTKSSLEIGPEIKERPDGP